MKVSIIVPFYNGNAYISNLISILEKNCEIIKKRLNYSSEIIIVNDSPWIEVVVNSINKYNNIRIIKNNKNRGIHYSRINGLKHSCGDLIWFIDQDDYASDIFLFDQIKKLKRNDFIVCNGYNESATSKQKIYKSYTEQSECLNKYVYYCYTCPIISPGQVLIKRSSIPIAWTKKFLSQNGADDFLLWMLMLEAKKKGIINPKPLYIHTFTGQNASLDISKMKLSNFEVVHHLYDKVAFWKTVCIKRRVLYNCEYTPTLLHKIKYFDVCILRYIFSCWYL